MGTMRDNVRFIANEAFLIPCFIHDILLVTVPNGCGGLAVLDVTVMSFGFQKRCRLDI